MNVSSNTTDFTRSHLRFRTTRVNHTPRLSVDAICTLTPVGQPARRYYLTCACIGEAMYLREGLIHEPVHEFNLVGAPGDEFMVVKRYADAAHDLRSAHSMHEVMPTHDGQGAKVVEFDVHIASHNNVQLIANYQQFRAALLEGQLINGRTSYTTDDGTRITLDYPARTVNVAHDQEAWQVDAGPILMPLPSLNAVSVPGENSHRLVETLEMAYLVYNRADYAEAVLRRPTPVLANVPDGAQTSHYSLRQNLYCQNEIFAVG